MSVFEDSQEIFHEVDRFSRILKYATADLNPVDPSDSAAALPRVLVIGALLWHRK